jgi:hypothetical protein
MKLCAPVPVFGRFPLVRMTISRLQRQGVTPIMMGHEREAHEIAKELNVEFIHVDNDPLGNKWNVGFQACKNYNADGVIFMGSSDWASDEYIESATDALNEFSFIGMLGCHFVDVADEVRLVHWPGYQTGQRRYEPIGIGRVLRSDILEKMNWTPFQESLSAGLDWSMYLKLIQLTDGIAVIKDEQQDIRLLSISTNRWPNKHKFEDHWSGKLLSKRLDNKILNKNFSDIFEL